MNRELLVDGKGLLRRAAVLTGGELTDLYIDRADRPARMGAVLLGRVVRLAAGLEAAFVEIGERLPALLNAADVRPAPKKGRELRIGQMLRTGQEVVVQVKADAHGDKGAVLTMDISLPGRFLVHLPQGQGVHLSKRLAAGPQRTALAAAMRDAVPPGGGWIVRADAAEADPGLVALEAEALYADWRAAESALAGAEAPQELLVPPAAPVRACVELGGAGFDAIRVEGSEALLDLKRWCAERAPDLAARITLHIAKLPLFETGDVEGAIQSLLDRRAPLSHGGSLVIERTEALTVIDVNGGERGNPLSTNLEAVREIARQLRLRNIGGIVVVDFINLAKAYEREQLILALSHAVSNDPAGTHVYGMSKLGLVEMTRSRRGPPLSDLLAPQAPTL